MNLNQYIENVRNSSPLVHHITNYVTVNDCARYGGYLTSIGTKYWDS